MKILLVYCNSMLENAIPIGLSQLSACLKEVGFTVELFDTTFYRYGHKSATENRIEALQIRPCRLNFIEGDIDEDFRKKIESFQPDVIGLSIVEPTFALGMRLLHSAKKIIEKNGIRVAVGGVHAILAPETITGHDLIDYICVSEAETAFVDLCYRIEKGMETKNTDGFWVKQAKSWSKNPKASITDINDLPILDFSIFPDAYLNKPMMGNLYRTISIETTRGCPYNCSYCADKALRDLFKNEGLWYRQKTIRQVEDELKEYANKYDPEFIYIMSDSFLCGKLERVEGFAEMYRDFCIPFWFNTRPEDITEEKVELMKEIGCKRVSIGLEQGNEIFRKKVLKRNYSNEEFRMACSILRKQNISFSANIIIGFPNETREMIFDSINVLRDIKPDGVSTHIYNPYHGTEMREICVRQGMIKPNLIAEDFFQLNYHLNNPMISKDEILGLFRMIPIYIEMDKKKYSLIRKAEKRNLEGDRIFGELKKEFYELKGWKDSM